MGLGHARQASQEVGESLMSQVGILDYGSGNVGAFLNVYQRLGIKAKRVNVLGDFHECSHLILPGVGSFDKSMAALTASGLVERLMSQVAEGTPLLGICVGMHMLAGTSEEGEESGLGLIPGKVKKLQSTNRQLPHMGWNSIVRHSRSALLNTDDRFYFLHSYYFDPDALDDAVAFVDFNGEFACGVQRGNVFGYQFHPEKSHVHGGLLLKRFAGI